MPNPNDPKKMTPFQEAMLKFEQALQESLAVEQARQAEAAARQAAPNQGRSMQRPARPGVYPSVQTRVAPAGPPAPVRQMPPDSYEGAMDHPRSNGEVYMNVGEHAVMPLVTETIDEIEPQVAAFDEPPVPIRKKQVRPASPALSAAPQPIIPLAPSASPLMQGIIWAEVLGKPVSKRRGHGRHGF